MQVVDAILKTQFDVNACDVYRFTSFDEAYFKNGTEKIIQLLTERGGKKGRLLYNKQDKLMKLFFQNLKKSDITRAIQIIEKIKEKGFSFNDVNKYGWTMLDRVLFETHPWNHDEYAEVIELLRSYGAKTSNELILEQE